MYGNITYDAIIIKSVGLKLYDVKILLRFTKCENGISFSWKVWFHEVVTIYIYLYIQQFVVMTDQISVIRIVCQYV